MINNQIDQTHVHHRLGHTLYVLGAFLLILFATILLPFNTSSSKAFGVSDIIKLSNSAREQFNSPILNVNGTLMNAAQTKAEDMANKHYFSHYGPDGTAPWKFFTESGYTYKEAGENLAVTNESAEAVVNGWLNSPTHRENLLSKQFNDFGIGIAPFGEYQGHKDTYIVVAFYGSLTSPLAVTGTETTNPAGTIVALKPKLFSLPPALIFSVAISLIIAGGLLELRHIRHLHKQKTY